MESATPLHVTQKRRAVCQRQLSFFFSYCYFSSIYFVFRTIVQLASLYETDALTFYNFILCLRVVGLTLVDGQS